MIRIITITLTLLLTTSSFAGKAWICSSFYINGDGYLATASHCVEGAKILTVVGQDRQYREAVLVAEDLVNDVAIIKVKGKSPDYYDIGLIPNEDKVVYILGYPIPETRGWNLKSKKGYVDRSFDGYYRIRGGTCEGNSGGPVVNSSNNVIGVLTFGYGSSPCAYYVGAQKIQHVLKLARQEGVEITIRIKDPVRLFSSEQSLDLDTAKTPILYGSS